MLKLVGKPNSVSGSCRTAAIYLSTTFRSGLSDLPENLTERAIPILCLILLQVGFTRLPISRSGRCALTLIPAIAGPHHFTLTPANAGTVSFLWHFPASRKSREDPALRDTLPCGVRTFLPDLHRSDCLTNFSTFPPLNCDESHCLFHPSITSVRKIHNVSDCFLLEFPRFSGVAQL